MGLTDKAANQLIDWQKGKQVRRTFITYTAGAEKKLLKLSTSQGKCEKIVTSHGIPVPSLTKTLTVGQRGPVLLQDNVLIETLAHWERERIPERVVHAKGAGWVQPENQLKLHLKVCFSFSWFIFRRVWPLWSDWRHHKVHQSLSVRKNWEEDAHCNSIFNRGWRTGISGHRPGPSRLCC